MEVEDISIICSDGVELRAKIYHPKEVKGCVMIAPATGIKKIFYDKFANFLKDNGYAVISYNNRGIGDSGAKLINTLNESLVIWGQLDMTSVLNELKVRYPSQKYHLVGHSAGGQLVGLMENALEIDSIFNVACSSGSIKNMKYPFKLAASSYLNVFIPISNWLFGKTNSQWVGMGEPLPKKVAAQWRKWCNGLGYVEMDFGKEIEAHYYNEIKAPSHWMYSTDDAIANKKNVADMTRIFSSSKKTVTEITPSEFGYKDIGHMKFFSSKHQKLWDLPLNWLEQNN